MKGGGEGRKDKTKNQDRKNLQRILISIIGKMKIFFLSNTKREYYEKGIIRKTQL